MVVAAALDNLLRKESDLPELVVPIRETFHRTVGGDFFKQGAFHRPSAIEERPRKHQCPLYQGRQSRAQFRIVHVSVGQHAVLGVEILVGFG